MSVALYMDENMHEAVTLGLRSRGVDVLTAQEDGMRQQPDPLVLDRVTELGRVAVSEDADFLAEAAKRQQTGVAFGGVIHAPQSLPIGVCIENLELIAKINEPDDHVGHVVYLPL